MIQIAAALVFLAAHQEPDLVSWYHAAAPTPVLIKELAAEWKAPLTCAPALADRIVIVSVKDVKKQDLLDRIALACGGEWTQESNGNKFLRPSAKQSKEAALAREQRVAAFVKCLARMREESTKPVDEAQTLADMRQVNEYNNNSQSSETTWEDYQRYESANARLPQGRLTKQIIASLDPATLADIPIGGRIVFSTQPTAMQLRLSSDLIMKALSDFNTANARAYAMKRKANNIPDDPESLNKTDPDYDSKMSEYFGVERIDPTHLKSVLVVVERIDNQYQDPNLGYSIRLFNRENEWPQSYDGEIPLDKAEVTESEAEWDPEKEAKRDPDEPKFEPSEESKLLVSAFADPKEFAKKAPEFYAKLLRPDLHEPLGYAPSELLKFWAEQSNLDLVTELQDEFLSFSVMGLPDTFSIKKLIAVMNRRGYLKVLSDDGWTRIATGPLLPRVSRIDRAALARVMSTVVRDGALTFDTLATYIANGGRLEMSGLGQWLRLAGQVNLPYLDGGAMRVLRLYGSLTESQRDFLRRGESIPYGSLLPKAKGFALNLVYGAQPQIKLEDGSAKGEVPDEENGMYNFSNPTMEPTILLPDGLSSNAQLRLVPGEHVLLYSYESAQQSQDEGWGQSPESAGSSAFYSSRPDLFPWVRDQRPRNFYRVGSASTMRFELRPTPTIVCRSIFRQDQRPSSGPAVSVDHLPAELRKQFQKGYDSAKESNKDAQPGQYGPAPKKNIP